MIDDFFIGKLGYIYQIPENKWCIPGSYFHKISLKVIKQNHKKSFKCMRFNDTVISDKQYVLKHKNLKLCNDVSPF